MWIVQCVAYLGCKDQKAVEAKSRKGIPGGFLLVLVRMSRVIFGTKEGLTNIRNQGSTQNPSLRCAVLCLWAIRILSMDPLFLVPHAFCIRDTQRACGGCSSLSCLVSLAVGLSG